MGTVGKHGFATGLITKPLMAARYAANSATFNKCGVRVTSVTEGISAQSVSASSFLALILQASIGAWASSLTISACNSSNVG